MTLGALLSMESQVTTAAQSAFFHGLIRQLIPHLSPQDLVTVTQQQSPLGSIIPTCSAWAYS